MKLKLITLVLLSALIFGQANSVAADEPDRESGSAANLAINFTVAEGKDSRVEKLAGYLRSHDSPLADEASHFVAEADRFDLDWKLVAAIAGVESTFGRFIPTGSYNGWGWAVFTGRQSGAAFGGWEEGISTVSQGLRENYLNRGAQTVEQIGRWYAASPAWAWKVRFFLREIETFTAKPSALPVVL